MFTNKDRVKRVAAALKTYRGADNISDKNEMVRDLLSDLRHYCDYYKIEFHVEDQTAYENYICEVDESRGLRCENLKTDKPRRKK